MFMSKKINLKEILSKYVDTMDDYVGYDTPIQNVKDAMIDFGWQLLELAAENAKTEVVQMNISGSVRIVNKQSILDTIKQVE